MTNGKESVVVDDGEETEYEFVAPSPSSPTSHALCESANSLTYATKSMASPSPLKKHAKKLMSMFTGPSVQAQPSSSEEERSYGILAYAPPPSPPRPSPYTTTTQHSAQRPLPSSPPGGFEGGMGLEGWGRQRSLNRRIRRWVHPSVQLCSFSSDSASLAIRILPSHDV